MSVVGRHEYLISGNRSAAVRAGNCISDEPRGAGTLIMPDLTSATGVERVALVGVGNIHHAGDDDWSGLHIADVVEGKDPLSLYFLNIGACDLREIAITAAGRLPVVARPIDL